MNRWPVGRRVEWSDAQRKELGPGIHLMIRGSPTLWKVVRHLEENVKMAERRKNGQEYGKSTKSQPREGRKMAGKVGVWKRHGNQEESEGNKPQKGGNSKGCTETKFQSVKNVRNAKEIANPTTKRALKSEKAEEGGGENDLEREGKSFRLERNEKNRV